MWQERPIDTHNWSEEDWEHFFKQQDEWYYHEVKRQLRSGGQSDFGDDVLSDEAILSGEGLREEAEESETDSIATDVGDISDLIQSGLIQDIEDSCEDEMSCPLEDSDTDTGTCPCSDEPPQEATEYELLLEEELNHVPAWRAAVEFSNTAFDFVQPRCSGKPGGPTQYLLRSLCQRSILVPDYISAGHEIGYEEDTLCGNIALCLRARKNLARCIECLERLGGAHDEGCRPLMVRACVTRTFLDKRIAELREQVWWR